MASTTSKVFFNTAISTTTSLYDSYFRRLWNSSSIGRVSTRVPVMVLHYFSPGLECLLDEAVERVVMGVSQRERREKRRMRWKGADGDIILH
jgi:hypothetical protein